jgi:hypothetical protein
MDEPQVTESTEPTDSTPSPQTPSKKSLEQPETQLPKSGYDIKRRAKIFTQSLLAGESRTQALVNAGYSLETAKTGDCALLKNPQYSKGFISILEEKGVTDNFLAEKTKSLLNAKKTLFFQKDGEVTDEREVEALETQRKTLELATKLKGHLKDQSQVDVNIGIMAMVVAAVKGDNGDGV